MSNPVSDRVHIAATAEALLTGQIPGPLTVVRLAEAAQVKRWLLTHKHADLMRDFQQRAASINRASPEIHALRRGNDELSAANKALRQRISQLDDLLARYAQVINQLTSEQKTPQPATRLSRLNAQPDPAPGPR